MTNSSDKTCRWHREIHPDAPPCADKGKAYEYDAVRALNAGDHDAAQVYAMLGIRFELEWIGENIGRQS